MADDHIPRTKAALECIRLDVAELDAAAATAALSVQTFSAALECVLLDIAECDPPFPSSDVEK